MGDQALNAMRDHFKLHRLDDVVLWQSVNQDMTAVFEEIFLAGWNAGRRSAALDELGIDKER